MDNFADTIDNNDHKAIFSDSDKLAALKKIFVRFTVEESLRRDMKEENVGNATIMAILHPNYKTEIVEPLWNIKKAEIDAKFQAK